MSGNAGIQQFINSFSNNLYSILKKKSFNSQDVNKLFNEYWSELIENFDDRHVVNNELVNKLMNYLTEKSSSDISRHNGKTGFRYYETLYDFIIESDKLLRNVSESERFDAEILSLYLKTQIQNLEITINETFSRFESVANKYAGFESFLNECKNDFINISYGYLNSLKKIENDVKSSGGFYETIRKVDDSKTIFNTSTNSFIKNYGRSLSQFQRR